MTLTFAEVAEVLGTLWSLMEAPLRKTLLLPESGEGKSLCCHFNFLASGSWLEAGFCVGSKAEKGFLGLSRIPSLPFPAGLGLGVGWGGVVAEGAPWRTEASNSLPGQFGESDRKKGRGKELERFLGCC